MTDTNQTIATKEFTVSLSKAHSICQRISDQANRLKEKTLRKVSLPVNVSDWSNKELIHEGFDKANVELMQNLGLAIRAYNNIGQIRATIGAANEQSGIAAKLATITQLKNINYHLEQVRSQTTVYGAREKLDTAINFFNESGKLEGYTGTQYFNVLVAEQIENLEEIKQLNNKQIQSLKDEIAELNYTTKITIVVDAELADVVGLL